MKLLSCSLFVLSLVGCGDNHKKPDAGHVSDASFDATTLHGTDSTGDPCATGASCLGGVCLQSWAGYTFPDGYCSQACMTHADCSKFDGSFSGTSEGCLTAPDSSRFCADACDSARDCRTGYVCFPVSDVPWAAFCWPASP